MKKSKFTDAQIAFVLRQAEEGTSVAASAQLRVHSGVAGSQKLREIWRLQGQARLDCSSLD